MWLYPLQVPTSFINVTHAVGQPLPINPNAPPIYTPPPGALPPPPPPPGGNVVPSVLPGEPLSLRIDLQALFPIGSPCHLNFLFHRSVPKAQYAGEPASVAPATWRRACSVTAAWWIICRGAGARILFRRSLLPLWHELTVLEVMMRGDAWLRRSASVQSF